MRNVLPHAKWVAMGVAVLFTTAFFMCGAIALGSGPPAKGSGTKSAAPTKGANSGEGASSAEARASQESSALAGTDFSMESEVLTYRSLDAVSTAIASQVSSTKGVQAGDTVLIATDEDASAFLDWRVAMGQIQLLREAAADVLNRNRDAQLALEAAENTPHGKSKGAGDLTQEIITSPAVTAGDRAVRGIVTGVAGIFAEKQAQVSVRGTIQDLALINATAGKLVREGLTVYIPNQYAPGLFGESGLSGTLMLGSLEALRGDQKALEVAIKKLSDTSERFKESGDSYKIEAFQRVGAPILSSAITTAASIDAFLARAFGIAAATQDEQSVAAGGGSENTSNRAAKGQPSGGPGATEAAGPVLPARIIRADLLAQRLGLTAGEPGGQKSQGRRRSHVLVLKALESGGTVMVKDSFFRTAYSYSGGSVSTFALYALDDGHLEDAGSAYAHDGFVRENHFGEQVRTTKPLVGPPEIVPEAAGRTE